MAANYDEQNSGALKAVFAMSSSPTRATGDNVPTETRPLPLTTRFAPPSGNDCEIRDLTTSTTGGDNDYYIYSDPLDERFTTCQPEGWANRPSSVRFSFSPAVCPSGWTWSSIQVTTIKNSKTTTAFCCDAGFSLGGTYNGDRSVYESYCKSEINLGQTLTATFSRGSGTTSTLTWGSMVHEPWQIAWQEMDQTMLTPAPPALTSGTTALARWDGTATSFGTDIATTTGDSSQNDLGISQGLILFLEIGIPLICLFLIGGCVLCCCCGKWTRPKTRSTRPSEVGDAYALRPAGTRSRGAGNT